jgi:hypothetical protein
VFVSNINIEVIEPSSKFPVLSIMQLKIFNGP